MREQNAQLIKLQAVMIKQYEEKATLQTESDLNRWIIDHNITRTFKDLQICTDPNATSDPLHDKGIFARTFERLQDNIQKGRQLNKKITFNQQTAQDTLIEYHAHVNDIIVHNTEMCAENLELIRTGQLTKNEMEELHVAMKRMVDEHAHNVTTPRQAKPIRRCFFGTRTDVHSSEEYNI